jgi:twitching motility protein PilT
MAQLDRLMATMFAHAGAEIQLTTGAEPMLLVAGKRAVLVPRPLHVNQVRFLLGEILDDGTRAKLERAGWLDFSYTPPGFSAVAVSVRSWHEDSTSARIRPETREDLVPSVPAWGTQTGAIPLPIEQGSLRVRGSLPMRASLPLDPELFPSSRPPVAKITFTLDQLLGRLVKAGASDLHLSTGQPPMMRQHGSMTRIPDAEPLGGEEVISLIGHAIPSRNREQFVQDNDTDFAYEIPGLARFRVNLFRDRFGPGIVARVIPTEVITAESLNLPPAIRNLCNLSKGLVLVTGPTGSGKSTTLSALVDLINRQREDHIITLEDPIEFVHTSKKCLVNQREVGVHTNDFKRALRAALREDPDVVLVGEMRDLETIAIAIETAETGHLVFGTLHTTTASSTVDRLIDQFPGERQEQIRVMLSESLKAVISQTLCRKIGGGRVAALEILLATPALSNLIREGKTFQIPSVMQTSRKLGMVLLNDALLQLVQGKKVEPREAYLRAVDKVAVLKGLAGMGINLDVSADSPE